MYEYADAGDEFYFLHVIAENQSSSSLMAGLDGLGGVDSALIVDASSGSGVEQVCYRLNLSVRYCHAEEATLFEICASDQCTFSEEPYIDQCPRVSLHLAYPCKV